MPVSIKPRLISIKDPQTGQYKDADMLSLIPNTVVVSDLQPPSDTVLWIKETENSDCEVPTQSEFTTALNGVNSALSALRPAATLEDVGKAIIVKTVENGEPTEYEYGEAGGGGGEGGVIVDYTVNAAPRVVEIDSGDLVSGKSWTAQGTQINNAGYCLYDTPIQLEEGETLVSIYNHSCDTGCNQYLWVTLNASNQVVRYGKHPAIAIQSGEVAIKVAFSMMANPLSNGRKVFIYSGAESMPQDKISAALTFGNDVVMDNLTMLSGYVMGHENAQWTAMETEKSTGVIDIPYGALSMEHNFPLDLDNNRKTLIFLDNMYNVVSFDNVNMELDIPEDAEHCVIQTHNYDDTASYYIRFKMSEVNAMSVSADLDELSEECDSMYRIGDTVLLSTPLMLTGIGTYDMTSEGTDPRYSANTGWHWQKFEVAPGEIYAYNFTAPTTHDNYLLLANKFNKCVSQSKGQVVSGTLIIPDGIKYMYISVRSNCDPCSLIKRNDKTPKVDESTDYIDSYITSLLAALNAQNITIDLVPSYYYGEHEKILQKVDKTGLKFAIFTDTHYKNDGTQPEYSRIVKELKRLQDEGVIDFVVHLGDAIENQTYSYTAFTDVLSNAGVNYMILKGNHDLIKQSVIRANCTNITGMTFDTLGCWAYLDDTTNNVRYIFLNSCDKGIDVDNDTATITMQQGDYSYRQLYWLANTALNTDKKVVLFNHIALKPSSSDSQGVKMSTMNDNQYIPAAIVNAFSNGTSGSSSYISSGESGAQSTITYDFTSQGAGDVICLFNGHGHGDWAYTTDNGLLSIMESNGLCINNMSATWGYTFPAKADTIDEIAFDIVNINPTTKKIKMWRFGRGIDREFN